MPEQDAVDQLHSAENSDTGSRIATIPDDAPDDRELPSRYGKIVNLAQFDTVSHICDRFRAWASTQIRRFEGQSQREEYTKTGGIMDVADRMSRVALNQDTSNSQTKNTLSDVTSPMFHIQVRTITAGETAIFFGDDRLPAEYSPEINTSEYTLNDGKRIAEHQNALAQFTFDEDKRRDKIRQLLHYTNKYANQVAYVEWIRETQEVTENVPDEKAGMNENGTFRKFTRKTRRRVVKDWPVLERIPIENCYFDALIDDLETQNCFGFKRRFSYSALAKLQADGYIFNVDKLTPAQFYKGEMEQDNPLHDRKTNAGESDHTEETGEIEVWTVWGMVPIGERTTPKRKTTKADWDGGKNAPTLYWGMFAGSIHSGASVCLKLCKNPHWYGKIPATLIHSHEDDKGAYRTGYAEMIQSLYWQACTNLNQAIDNVTERNFAPMTANGPVLTRDLTFKKNKLIQLDRSTDFKRLDIPDTTRITMEMHAIIEDQANALTGADKPIRAEALGSRTSATEAKNVFDQASQPLDEKAAYVGDQLFPWLYEIDAMFWRQYGDPSTVLRLTHNDTIIDVNPGELWGPIRTKVTAVSRFRNNTVQRQQINNMLQNILPMFLGTMEKRGITVLGREVFRMFGIEKIDEIFPDRRDVEAEAAAQRDVQSMLVGGVFVEPQPEENHDARIPIMENAAEQYRLLPPESMNDAHLQMLLFHIAQRRQMSAQQKQAVQSALQSGQSGPQEGLPGEVASNPVEAQEGALAAS